MFDPAPPTPEDESLSLDYVFGASRGPSLVRKAVADLNALLGALAAGDTDVDSVYREIGVLQGRLHKAVASCIHQKQKKPARAAYFEANAEAYCKGLDGLGVMVSALERRDPHSLWQGMAAFEASVLDVDALVDQERDSQ
jgi:hypothetical protein